MPFPGSDADVPGPATGTPHDGAGPDTAGASPQEKQQPQTVDAPALIEVLTNGP